MLSPEEQVAIFERIKEYDSAVLREQGQSDFMKFVTTMWPGFIHGRHHALMAKKFEEIAEGGKKLLAANVQMKDIIPTLHTLGNIAIGVGTNQMPSLIDAFSSFSLSLVQTLGC